MTPQALIDDMAMRARAASRVLSGMATARKAAALRAAAAALRASSDDIIAANRVDLAAANASGMAAAMVDRLTVDSARIVGIAAAVEAIAALPDPVGAVIEQSERPNGLKLSRIRVPLGVIGIIYESRPNVTADAGMLCVMSGNAAILRGGSEAVNTNRAIFDALVMGLVAEGLPADAIQLVPTTDRAAVGAMLAAHGKIDVIIPRGGKTLVARVQADARVPVLAHLDGINHTYIDAAADPAQARTIAVNAKMRRPGICGAMETLLIDRAFGDAAAVVGALADSGCELRGDADALALDGRVKPATSEDWDTEYLEPICAVKIVDGLDGALAHIAAHASHHTDAIITEDTVKAETFLNAVDSAIVMWNASSQFADGGEFGLGAEIGIATGRLHARGPVALEGLTTYKWLVRGTGQVRPELTGILGGSFNPAHGGHRRISLFVADAMGLDDVWWLVSPGNPLKAVEGMAPYEARLASARTMARRSIIRASDIEAQMGTRFTADTLAKLIRRYPKRRFVWIMGADNLAQFHFWRDWRRIARMVPIAVVARPGYEAMTVASPATAWLRRFVRPEAGKKMWTHWRPPALVLLHFRPDPTSATALRRADPDWYRRFSTPYQRNDRPLND